MSGSVLRTRRPSQRDLALLVAQLPRAFVWTTDRELRVTSLAGGAVALLGIEDPDEVVGRGLATLLGGATSDGGATILDAHRRALAGESATFVEHWRRWAFDVHVEPLRDEGGIVGAGGIALDASKRVAAEQALTRSEVRFRMLVERLPSLVTYVNPLGLPITTTYISPQIEDLLGFPAECWLDDADFWVSRVHPDDRDTVVAAAERTRESGEAFRAEYRLVASDGSIVSVRDETVPVHDEHGEPLFLQGFLLDLGRRDDAAAVARL